LKRRDLIILLGGAVAFWPFAGVAQKAMPVIGWLGASSAGSLARELAAFREGLGENGYVEGQNLAIEYRWAEGRYDQLPTLVADLIGQRVDLIVTSGGNLAALAAKNATATISIVFETGVDPVENGLVASLARPGGNFTGVSNLVIELDAKRLELLSEMVPQVQVIALLVNPTGNASERIMRDVQEAARAKGVQFRIVVASAEDQIEAAFAALVKLNVGALIVSSDPFFNSRREQIVELASRHAVPAIFASREFAAAGGLMSLGTSLPAVYRQIGTYAGKILSGAKPADLPVQQSTKSELVINLKTAKTLGITVPQSLLARADEVIE
jgi:putative ABC transport system substrate-binding protein